MYTIYLIKRNLHCLFRYSYVIVPGPGSGSGLHTSFGFGTVSAYDNDLKYCNTIYLIKCENYKTVAFDYVNNGF